MGGSGFPGPGFDEGHPLGRCPVCDSRTRRRFRSPGKLTLYRCERCALVYSDPQPRAEVERKYLEEYDLAAHFGPLAARKRVLYERRLNRLGPPTGRRLCDLGCGDGQFLELAIERGWEASGIEMNPAAATRAEQRGATVYRGRVEEVEGLPVEGFDAVTAWDSVEHTPEPITFLRKAAALLRPAGVLALTTLNVDAAVARVFRDDWTMYVEDHFTYWNRQSLSTALRVAGFTVTDRWGAGIGRDFAKLVPLRRRDRGSATATTPAPARFDSNPILARAEDGVNGVLGAMRLGVEVGAMARSAERPPDRQAGVRAAAVRPYS